METLEKARKPPVPGIIPSMVETFQAPQENIERYGKSEDKKRLSHRIHGEG